MELFEVLLWIIGILVVVGVVIGVLGFLGLRKLWHVVSDGLSDEDRGRLGDPPLSRRGSSATTRGRAAPSASPSTVRDDPH